MTWHFCQNAPASGILHVYCMCFHPHKFPDIKISKETRIHYSKGIMILKTSITPKIIHWMESRNKNWGLPYVGSGSSKYLICRLGC